MTCIVGFIDAKRIYIGADSLGVCTYNGSQTIRQDKKVFIKDNMIFGFTSSFRMGQVLQYSVKIPKHDYEKTNHEYMCTDFIDEVRTVFQEKGIMKEKDLVQSGGYFIVGYKNKLYDIQSDFQIGITSDNYIAEGSGEFYAEGVLYALNSSSKMSAVKKITLALKAAQHHNAFVKEPFTILSIKKE